MKKVIVTLLVIVMMLSVTTFVFASDNLRVEKKADLENIVGTTADEIVEDVEELEDEIKEDLDEIKNTDLLISPNSTLISTDESNTTFAPKDTDSRDVYVADDNIDLSNRSIDGNLFLMGDNISVNQVSVKGDAFILGKNVVINYLDVDNSIYFLSGDVTANTISARDVYSLGANLNIASKTMITRTLNFLGDNISLDGVSIGKDLNFYGNNSNISGETEILGTFNYRSPNEAIISEDSSVNDINKTIIDNSEIEIEEEKTPQEIFKNLVVTFLLTWIAGILMLVIVAKVEGPVKYKRPVGRIIGEFFLGLVIGLALLVVGVILIVFTAGIAAGIVLVLWVLLFVASLFAGAGAAHSFARATTKSYDGKKVFWLAFAIYTVYTVLKLVPYTKIICPLVFLAIGTGHNTIEFCRLLTKKFEVKEPIAKEDAKVAVEPPVETPAVEPEVVEPKKEEAEEEKEEKEEE